MADAPLTRLLAVDDVLVAYVRADVTEGDLLNRLASAGLALASLQRELDETRARLALIEEDRERLLWQVLNAGSADRRTEEEEEPPQ